MNPNNIKFTGVMPALITPLTERETVNVPVLHQLINGLLNQGANGFYIGGATGEGILWGAEIGAAIAKMGAYQGHAFYSEAFGASVDQGIANRGGIFVNQEGVRFCS